MQNEMLDHCLFAKPHNINCKEMIIVLILDA